MSEIRFRNAAHRDFFLESMMKCRVNDCYHRAFFYVMGIAGKQGRTSTPCSILRRTASSQRDARRMADERHGQGSATLPLTSGTVTPRRA